MKLQCILIFFEAKVCLSFRLKPFLGNTYDSCPWPTIVTSPLSSKVSPSRRKSHFSNWKCTICISGVDK